MVIKWFYGRFGFNILISCFMYMCFRHEYIEYKIPFVFAGNLSNTEGSA